MPRPARGREVALALAFLGGAAVAQKPDPAPARPHLALALEVARWLDGQAVRSEHGVTWRIGKPFPDDRRDNALYHGGAGGVLFFLELHGATGDASHLKTARAAADFLIATLPSGEAAVPMGLYTGVAGVGTALLAAHRHAAVGERYAEAARRCVALLTARARMVGEGVEWGPVTDVIGGGAGVGLFLLQAADVLEDSAALDLARRAGVRLLPAAIPAGEGARWPMRVGAERNYPNFSHGTAGVAFFLAKLHAATADEAFLQGALRGARYLEDVEKNGLVFHHAPGGEELFYLGWCHGPTGTSRLYRLLGELTGEKRWKARARAGLDALVASGIPGRRTSGFWNNAGQCCGTAGVIECLLTTGTTDAHRALQQQLTDDLVAAATRDAEGARWAVAEHRVRPELVGAQTGYMQGAAGIGLCLLHLDGDAVGRKRRVVLPDEL